MVCIAAVKCSWQLNSDSLSDVCPGGSFFMFGKSNTNKGHLEAILGMSVSEGERGSRKEQRLV